MAHMRFSEQLVARRRELGLSISQASKILKLKEDVLMCFESGDFKQMPQSGYAQGMLASYARYLGLNPREIVDLFQEEFYEYKNGTSSHELRRRTRDNQAGRGLAGYEVVNEAASRPKAYVEYHGLLPTAGGPAGDMGAYATTSRPQSRQSLSASGSSLSGADQTTQTYRSRYDISGDSSYPQAHMNRRMRGSDPADRFERARQTQREREQQRYQSWQERDGLRSARSTATRARTSSLHERELTSRVSARDRIRSSERDDVRASRVNPQSYVDDMRMGSEAASFERASSAPGRYASSSYTSTARPRVQRRQSAGHSLSRRQEPRNLRDYVADFFSGGLPPLFVIIFALGVVLTIVLVLSVSSCVNAKLNPSRQTANSVEVQKAPTQSTTIDVTPADHDKDQKSDTQTEAQGDKNLQNGQSQNAQDQNADPNQSPAYVETKVEVSVAAGSVSWLEITNDGQSVLADTITGPWTQSFVVHDNITISAGKPGAVSVNKNGERVDFTSRASGLGTMTIKGTPAPPEPTQTQQGQTQVQSGAQTNTQKNNQTAAKH